jgi:GntR family transcriptional regulator, transcriptional repressor for pyruvate dehydrogenase complex
MMVNAVGKTIEFRKRSDFLADEIKARIVTGRNKPGDRLPRERDLAEEFGVSKWTIRETLKSLEVQGLVKVATGPSGGATILEISEVRAMQLLGAFFYFRPPLARDIYQVRCLLEPELAESAVDHISGKQIDRLEELIEEARKDGKSMKTRHRQRNAELEFHSVIAEASRNPFLVFACRFMNQSLADLVVFRRMHHSPHRAFAADNCHFHELLVDGFRSRDKARVRELMTKHMHSAADYMVRLEGEIDPAQLMNGVRSNS